MTKVGPRATPSRSAPTVLRRTCRGSGASPRRRPSRPAREVGERGLGRDLDARRLRERAVHRQTRPLPPRSELGAVGPRDRRRPGDGPRRVLDELMREGRRSSGSRAVRLVASSIANSGLWVESAPSLRKLRLISNTPLKPADDGSLEESFRRDPEVQLGVERVAVRDERAGRGAAVHRLQQSGVSTSRKPWSANVDRRLALTWRGRRPCAAPARA